MTKWLKKVLSSLGVCVWEEKAKFTLEQAMKAQMG